MDNQQDSQLSESKNQSLERGVAFQEIIRSKGWGFIKLYYQTQVQAFATALLIEGKPITDYEGLRHELIGLKKLLGFIDNDIKTLEDEHKKDSEQGKR